MSHKDLAISVRDLGKSYTIRHDAVRHTTLAEAALHRLKNPFQRQEKETFWALQDINLDINQGDVVGIIGRNGAGKSTLLKVLSRITAPTTGRIDLYGRVGSLLEVGTGFHPELTGRENIYLNGAILGMRRHEINQQFDNIVEFAGVSQFLDTPVKRYSSGMRVRLAFAVAAHLQNEILIVDEVLAVGDAEFQKKCLGKMQDVAGQGRTVLFVSHNMGMIRHLCHRVICLRDGSVDRDGQAQSTIDSYLDSITEMGGDVSEMEWNDEDAPGEAGFSLRKVSITDAEGTPQLIFTPQDVSIVNVHYELIHPVRDMRIILQLYTNRGELAFMSTDHLKRDSGLCKRGRYISTCRIPPYLLNTGRHTISLRAGTLGAGPLLQPTEVLAFTVTGVGNQGATRFFKQDEHWPGVVCPRLDWQIHRDTPDETFHHFITNAPINNTPSLKG